MTAWGAVSAQPSARSARSRSARCDRKGIFPYSNTSSIIILLLKMPEPSPFVYIQLFLHRRAQHFKEISLIHRDHVARETSVFKGLVAQLCQFRCRNAVFRQPHRYADHFAEVPAAFR